MASPAQSTNYDERPGFPHIKKILNTLDGASQAVALKYFSTGGRPLSFLEIERVVWAETSITFCLFSLGIDLHQMTPKWAARDARREMQDWFLWSGGFALAEDDIYACYAELRHHTRWSASPLPTIPPTPDDRERATLVRLERTLRFYLDSLEPMPSASPSYSISSPVATRLVLLFILRTIFRPFYVFCIGTYLATTLTHDAFRFKDFARLGGVLVVFMALRYFIYPDDEYTISGLRQRLQYADRTVRDFSVLSKEHVTFWKILHAAVQDILLRIYAVDAEWEVQVKALLVTIDEQLFRAHRDYSTPLRTFLERLAESDQHDCLLPELEKYLEFTKGRALRIQSLDSQLNPRQQNLEEQVAATNARLCSELGSDDHLIQREVLHHLFSPETQEHGRYNPRKDFRDAISLLALYFRSDRATSGLSKPLAEHVRARSVWAGGMGRAQHAIDLLTLSILLEPTTERLRQLNDCLESYLHEHDLVGQLREFRKQNVFFIPQYEKAQLIGLESLKSIAPSVMIFFVPTIFSKDTPSASEHVLMCIYMALYSWLLIFVSPGAFERLWTYLWGADKDAPDIRRGVAALEYQGLQLLLTWKALQACVQAALVASDPALILDVLRASLDMEEDAHDAKACPGCRYTDLTKNHKHNAAVHKQVDAVYPDVHLRDGEIVSMGKVVAAWCDTDAWVPPLEGEGQSWDFRALASFLAS